MGWDPAGLDVLRAAGWNPAEHPRVLHGEHGGQFTRAPGGGQRGDPGHLPGTVAEWAGLLGREAAKVRAWPNAAVAGQLEGAARALKEGSMGLVGASVDQAATFARDAGRPDDGFRYMMWAAKIRGDAP